MNERLRGLTITRRQGCSEKPYNPAIMHFHIVSGGPTVYLQPVPLSLSFKASTAKCEKRYAYFDVLIYCRYACCTCISVKIAFVIPVGLKNLGVVC